MKDHTRMLIGMLAIGVLVGIVIYGQETTVVYESSEQPANESAVETPDCMQVVKDEDACKAAEAVIKRKELEAESAKLGEEIKQLDTKRAELKARQVDIDKQAGSY